MNEMSQKLRAFHDSGSRTREIRISIHGIHATIAHRRQFGPARIFEQLWSLLDHLIEIEAAWRYDQDFRRPFQNIIPGNPDRIRSSATKRIDAARYVDHLRHPVAAAINRIEPL